MKKHIIIILLLLLSLAVHSQDKYKITEKTQITKSAIDSLEEVTNALIKRDKELRKIKGLKQLHIFSLPFKCDIPKEEFLTKEFLKKLLPQYIIYNQGKKIVNGCLMSSKNTKSCLMTDFIIYDSIGKGKAIGEFLSLYKYKKEDYKDYYLLQLFLNNEIDFVFKIDVFFGDYICVKDSNIFVLQNTKDNKFIKDYNWEDYANKMYEKYIEQCKEFERMGLKY